MLRTAQRLQKARTGLLKETVETTTSSTSLSVSQRCKCQVAAASAAATPAPGGKAHTALWPEWTTSVIFSSGTSVVTFSAASRLEQQQNNRGKIHETFLLLSGSWLAYDSKGRLGSVPLERRGRIHSSRVIPQPIVPHTNTTWQHRSRD